MTGKLFAWTICGLSLCASLGYFVVGDIRHGLYWFCTAAIIAVVTY